VGGAGTRYNGVEFSLLTQKKNPNVPAVGTTLFALAVIFVKVAGGGTGDPPGISNKRDKRSRVEDAGGGGGKAFGVEESGDMRSFKGTKA
jgi:hypothetical protein